MIISKKMIDELLSTENCFFAQIMDSPRGYLQIVNAQLDDSGEYACVAVDENQCRSEKSATLTVISMAVHSECKILQILFMLWGTC